MRTVTDHLGDVTPGPTVPGILNDLRGRLAHDVTKFQTMVKDAREGGDNQVAERLQAKLLGLQLALSKVDEALALIEDQYVADLRAAAVAMLNETIPLVSAEGGVLTVKTPGRTTYTFVEGSAGRVAEAFGEMRDNVAAGRLGPAWMRETGHADG